MDGCFLLCLGCRTSLDIGYRWAYWQLEAPGIVVQGQPIDRGALLGATGYWNPSRAPEDDTGWLYDGVFPALRQFLHDHEDHPVIYGTENHIDWGDEGSTEWTTWMEVGPQPLMTPRYYAEIRGMSAWAEVEADVDARAAGEGGPPWWWYDATHRDEGRRAFERVVHERAAGGGEHG
jgi:hypothetical protein